jgi:hypothetical protein
MSNSKISALTSASTPLAGTEVLPIVQSSATTKVTIANITAGRSVSAADYVMSTGNLVPSTAAKGINFTANTPAAGMTSQLLNWYEEGSWTPTDASGAGLSLTITYAKYVRVGKSVTVNAFINYPATASAAAATIGGLPFSVGSNNYPPVTFANNSGTALSGFANATAKTISIGTAANYSASVSNVVLSGRVVLISLTYLVD